MTFLPDLASLLAFTLAALVLTITPGPDMTLFLGRTLAQGRAAGVAAMLGASTGILVHTTLAAVGLSALIAASPEAFMALRIGGAAYLAWLAYQAIRHGSSFSVEQGQGRRRSLSSEWARGISVNLLNPKVILFNVTFMPQFVSVSDPYAWQKLFFFGFYFLVLSMPICFAMILGAERVANVLRRRPAIARSIDYAFATVFSGFAVSIFMTGSR